MKNGFSECFEIQDKNRFCEIKSHIHQQNTQNSVHTIKLLIPNLARRRLNK